MTDYALAGLVRRRADLSGEIERTHTNLKRMVADLEVLDAVILQFDPTFDVESVKARAFRPPADWANRGEMSRLVLSILRQAVEPLTTRDIALEMLVSRALDKNDQRLLRLMTKRVGVALRTQKDKGLVDDEQGPGQYNLWRVVRKFGGELASSD